MLIILETSHKPRYCFGYGLSYGEFVYSDMKISKPEVKPDELITVSCQVMNVSNADATEIVQCYISDRFASRTRPVKEFGRICEGTDSCGRTTGSYIFH